MHVNCTSLNAFKATGQTFGRTGLKLVGPLNVMAEARDILVAAAVVFTFVQPPLVSVLAMSEAVPRRRVMHVTGPGFVPGGVGRSWDRAGAPSAGADGGRTWS